MKVAWKHVNVTYENTYVNHSLGHWLCIDHCIVSDNVFNERLDNRVVDSNDNLSNHLPVELSFSVNVNTRKDSGNRQGPNNDRCFSIQWNKANEMVRRSYIVCLRTWRKLMTRCQEKRCGIA